MSFNIYRKRINISWKIQQGFDMKTVEKFSHSYRTESWYYQSFIYSPIDALVSCLKNNIKIYIKTAPTYFGVTVTPSSGSALIRAY